MRHLGYSHILFSCFPWSVHYWLPYLELIAAGRGLVSNKLRDGGRKTGWSFRISTSSWHRKRWTLPLYPLEQKAQSTLSLYQPPGADVYKLTALWKMYIFLSHLVGCAHAVGCFFSNRRAGLRGRSHTKERKQTWRMEEETVLENSACRVCAASLSLSLDLTSFSSERYGSWIFLIFHVFIF